MVTITSALSDQNEPSLSLGDGHDLLRIGEPDAGRDARPCRRAARAGTDDMRLRVLLVEDVDRLDVVGLGHRALDRDRERHRVAVLDQRRQVELDLAFAAACASPTTP